MTPSLDFLSHSDPPSRPARKWPAWLLPVGILLAFVLLFAGLYRDRLWPATVVPVAPVVVSTDASTATALPATEGAPLFQASGWVEPDPHVVKAAALVDGVVASVHVLEGQKVAQGDLLVTLIDEDATLALAAAEGHHRVLVSRHAAHLAATEAMIKRSGAAQAETLAARTMEAEADDQLARQDRLTKASVVSESDFTTARLRLQREQSLHLAAQARAEELKAEIQRMHHETKAMENEVALAAVAVQQARLALDRTHIRAPLAGRILRLNAAPGDKKMLSMDHPESSTVCALYDPAKLQVRVDVPLADAARLQVGQPVRIHTSLLPDTVFSGEVTRLSGEADLQRNTLQAKVSIIDPSDQLRPEMLCRVEFLGTIQAGAASPTSALGLWVPREAIHGDEVWVCDPETRRLTRRTIKATPETKDNHIRIAEGLRPGEQVVLTPGPWREGQRVAPSLKQP